MNKIASLPQKFSSYHNPVDTVLKNFFDTRIVRAHRVHIRYELLWRELSRLAGRGGKRLRPNMTLLAYEAFGGKNIAHIVPIAAAQELLHTSLLAHDDIIDSAVTRRGGLNLSGVYDTEHYRSVTNPGVRRHYAESAALLGGDLLLATSSELMDEADVTAGSLRAAKEIFYRCIFEVAGGQLLDNEAAFLPHIHTSAEQIARYKTASYSFVCPLLIGATLAKASANTLKHLEAFALNAGIAFQLSDDVLGVFGNEKLTGKSTISDLREGKRTMLIEKFMGSANTSDIRLFQRYFGTPDLDEAEALTLRELLTTSGALPQTEEAMRHYTSAARIALGKLGLKPSYHKMFEQLLLRLTHRQT